MAAQTLPDQALKTAMVTAIEGYSGVSWTVYKKRVTDNTQMPYAFIGSVIHMPFWNKSTWGTEGQVTVHNWSRLSLDTEINNMNSLTNEAITATYPMTVAGFNCYRMRVEQFLTMRTEDEFDETQQAWHGILIFSFRISSTARR